MKNRYLTDLGLTALAALALAAGGLLHASGMPAFAAWPWIGISVLLFLFTAAKILRSLAARQPGVDLIALLSIGGALALGEYLTASVIALMLASGRSLESYAERRAGRDMAALLEKVPRHASRYQEGHVVQIALEDIRPGDRLLVRTGETVPADGTLVSSRAEIDASTLTGESRTLVRTAGDSVQSGAINAGAPFDMLSIRAAQDSALAAIVRLVRSAQQSRAPAVRLADRYALLFVPLTLAMAAIAWLLSGDPVRALAVVVVATPCPLLLGVPVALVCAMSRAARYGVLIKHGGALERLARADTLFFDKTGTLTGGQARLVAIVTEPDIDEAELLRLAASLDQMSDHAIARAVVEAARERGLTLSLPQDVREQAGSGLEGIVDGRKLRIGGSSYAAGGHSPAWLPRFERRIGYEGASAVFVQIEGRLAGALQLADEIRLDTPRALRLLRSAGVAHTVMLTGDRDDIARTIGGALGVDEVLSEQTPAGKLEAIRARAHRGVTVMVGDGVNDAPALAAADLGVAMGARGAAAAAEAAQIVLLEDRLDRLAIALRIAKRTRTIALQTVIGGMGLSLLAMVAAALGYLPPLAGAVLQEGIDVVAILNALRVLGVERRDRRAGMSSERAAHERAEHAALRPLLDRTLSLAACSTELPKAQLCERLSGLTDALSQQVIAHERHDEIDLYPDLARAIGGEDPTAAMSHAQREVFRLIRTLERLKTEDADDLDRLELQRVLYALDAILRLHFAHEEELYHNLSA